MIISIDTKLGVKIFTKSSAGEDLKYINMANVNI
jgi:hypothetical protein